MTPPDHEPGCSEQPGCLPPPPLPSPALVAKALVVVALLGWIAYANSLTKTFILDDDRWILSNEVVDDWAKNLHEHLQRPIIALSISLNYAIGGHQPAGYHLLNGLIHIGAALALFGIVRRTLLLPRFNRTPETSWAPLALPLAFATAAIWVVHPLNTHAVTYIIQRCESGMGLCYALAMYLMIRGSQSPRPAVWYLGSIAAAWVGVGCKEVIVTIVAVGLLYDRMFLANSWLELLRRRWWLYLGWSTILYWPMRIHLQNLLAASHAEAAEVGFVTVGFNVHNLDWKTYLLTEPSVIVHYFRLALAPFGLCFDYRDWPLATTSSKIAGVALLGVLLLCLYGCYRRNGFAFLGMTWFLVLSVTSSVMPLIDVANEYRTYVPLMAATAAVVIAGYHVLSRLWPAFARSTLVQTAAVAPVVIGLLLLTYQRNEDYRSPITMWHDALEKRPDNAKVYADLGSVYMQNLEWAEARKYLEASLVKQKNNYYGLLNLGIVDSREGRTKEGLDLLLRAHTDYPTNREITDPYLGLFFLLNDQPDSALKYLHSAVEVAPHRPMGRYYLAGALLMQPGREDEGRTELAKAVAEFPGWGESLVQSARSHLNGGFGDTQCIRRETLFFATIAQASAPSFETDRTLAEALAWNGRYADALVPLQRAIDASLTPQQKRELEERRKSYEAKVK